MKRGQSVRGDGSVPGRVLWPAAVIGRSRRGSEGRPQKVRIDGAPRHAMSHESNQ